jgi:uncharacterized cupredoxin-like copper-binding protein
MLRLACAAALPAGLALLPIAAASNRGPATLQVTERDFSIKAPRHVRGGDVELIVHNKGPASHELIVVREGRGGLPLRSDGLTVDEGALEQREAGALEPGTAGAMRKLDVHLGSGRYVLFCNMSGHYLGGMRTVLVVR